MISHTLFKRKRKEKLRVIGVNSHPSRHQLMEQKRCKRIPPHLGDILKAQISKKTLAFIRRPSDLPYHATAREIRAVVAKGICTIWCPLMF